MKKYILFLIGFLPLLASGQLVMSNNYNVVLSGGTSANPTKLVLTDSASTAIKRLGTGNIISENEFNMVDWYIRTSTGSFVVPFGDVSLDYLPVTLNIGTAGTGSGDIKFSTYHTTALNSTNEPSDVGNMTPFFLPGNPSNADNSYNVADRFYVIDANTGYTTKPTAGNITFSYMHATANTEVGAPNILTESRLMAQRYNSTTNSWNDWFGYGCTDAVVSNVGTVQTGPVPAADLFRSWSLWDNLQSLPVKATGTNLTVCGSNGSVSATVYGGKSPYTYAWSPSGATTSSITGLSAGTYSVTAKDASGCSGTASITITQPAISTMLRDSMITTSTINVSCNGGANGQARVGVKGGTAPYTYSWAATSGSNANLTGLSAGTYSVYVTDKNGCSTSSSITLTQPTQLRDSLVSLTGPACSGGANGTATIGVKGGTTPYTYTWTSGVSTTATATTLKAQAYTVNVKDKNGCSQTVGFTVTQPLAIRDSIVAATKINVSCNGGNNGSATVGVKFGTSPYTFVWSPNGGTNATASNLTAGTYTVNITDKNGCSATVSGTITQSATLLRDSMVSIKIYNETCNGNSSGGVTVGVKGGTAPYTYSWAPASGSAASISGVSAGSYTVFVTDKNGCTVPASQTITQPILLQILDSININVSCNSGSNGSAGGKVIGGTSPYTYSWSPGSGTTAVRSNLTAGIYTLTTTDSHHCTASLSFSITQPAASLAISMLSQTNIKCNGGTGSATANAATGGTSPYSYNWSPSGGTSLAASNLSAGVYTISATDAHGCTASASANITQPAVLAANAVAVNILCHGGTGSAQSSPSGGTSPYTYTWTGGATTSSITGKTAGTYTVTVKDNSGCSATGSVSITQPASALAVSISTHTNLVCNGTNIGSATANVATGGTSPYTYNWAPSGGTTLTASNLSGGSYTISATDNNGCSATASVSITQPALLRDSMITADIVNIGCNGGSTGDATVGVKGGTAPYTYSWSPLSGSAAKLTGMSARSYTVNVTDKNGCTASATITMTQPVSIRDSLVTSTGPTCNGGDNGVATIGVKGGTTPYTYLWSPSVSTTSSASTLKAQSYMVTVKDKSGCSEVVTFTLTQPLAIRDSIIAATKVNVSCSGGNTGSATVGVKFGSTPYTYLWSPNGGTNATASNLSASSYTVTVTDKNGCTGTASTTITQPTLLRDSIVTQSCSGINGSATVGVKGGTTPYTYSWAPVTGTKATETGLSNGTYTITVKDKNGCSQTTTVSFLCSTVPPRNDGPVIPDTCCPGEDLSGIKLYPNPNTGEFKIEGVQAGQIVQLYDYTGRLIKTETVGDSSMLLNISNQANGVYLVRILSKDGVLVSQKKVVKTQ